MTPFGEFNKVPAAPMGAEKEAPTPTEHAASSSFDTAEPTPLPPAPWAPWELWTRFSKKDG